MLAYSESPYGLADLTSHRIYARPPGLDFCVCPHIVFTNPTFPLLAFVSPVLALIQYVVLYWGSEAAFSPILISSIATQGYQSNGPAIVYILSMYPNP